MMYLILWALWLVFSFFGFLITEKTVKKLLTKWIVLSLVVTLLILLLAILKESYL